MKQTVTVNEAAALLRVCRRTIYYFIERGQLQTRPGACRTPRIDVDDLAKIKPCKRKGIR